MLPASTNKYNFDHIEFNQAQNCGIFVKHLLRNEKPTTHSVMFFSQRYEMSAENCVVLK